MQIYSMIEVYNIQWNTVVQHSIKENYLYQTNIQYRIILLSTILYSHTIRHKNHCSIYDKK